MRAPQSVAAAHSLSQAEMHVVLGENGQALTSARQALEQDRDFPEAMALVAYLEAIGADAETTTYIQDSLNLVNSAIRKKDTCKRAYYYRAEIKKLLEDHEGAIADLDVAVAQDPNDVDARRELRVYEQKVKDGSIKLGGSPDSQKSSKGFFDRLRGK
jgi:tetratricopeptide (TPR) repeat protein